MSDEKKIIIDEDWKDQVQAEKEAASTEEETPDANAGMQMPPASFEFHISTLATEAMVALGQIPHPLTGQSNWAPEQAKYFIDTIEVLQEKTAGNLTDEESAGLKTLLHQLRMAFLAGPPEPEGGATPSPGTSPDLGQGPKPGKIEI